MARRKTTAERGKFKQEVSSALYKNADILDLILGDTSSLNASKKRTLFKEHVKSHLFIDDTITETTTYIFYDIAMPNLRSNIKDCRIIMCLICHRDILEGYSKEGYFGDRIDILSQMVEDSLVNDKEVSNSFGIGELNLDSIEPYNSTRFYGCSMVFSVPNFR